MRSRALHPLRSALVAVLVTAGVFVLIAAGDFLTDTAPSSADLGALPPTGTEVVLHLVVVVAAFLATWVLVMGSGLVRGRAPRPSTRT